MESMQFSPRAVRGIDHFIPYLLLINITLYIVELATGSRNSLEGWRGFLWLERATALFFTVEYVWRILHAPAKRRYLMSPLGIIDLLSVVPFWIGFWPGLTPRTLELIRLARFIRLAKLYRYDEGLRHFVHELVALRWTLFLAARINLILLIALSACVFVAERDGNPDQFSNLWEAMRYIVVTLSTIGYGDQIPKSGFGCGIFYVTVAVGVGTMAGSIGILGLAFTRAAEKINGAKH